MEFLYPHFLRGREAQAMNGLVWVPYVTKTTCTGTQIVC